MYSYDETPLDANIEPIGDEDDNYSAG